MDREKIYKDFEEGKISLDDIIDISRADAIYEFSSELFKVIKRLTVNYRFDFTIVDLHNLEIVIKDLAEQLKENKNE